MNRLVGTAQSFDHAGNLTSALVAICLLAWLPVTSIFYAVAAVSVLAAALVFVIRDNEVDDDLACGGRRKDQPAGGFLILLRDERVAILFAAIAVVAALLFVLLMPETRIDFAIPRRSGEL